MANKEFQARHGLIVNTNLLIANVITGNVSVNGNVSISNTLVVGNTNLFQRANSLVFSANGSDAFVITPNTTGVMLEVINTATQLRVFSVSDTGNVYAASNVSANYFYGNGATLVGISSNPDYINISINIGTSSNASNVYAMTFANGTANSSNAYATTVGAASNTWANTKLSNTSGVSFAGNLNFPTGNVGIKTITPSASLDVNGAIAIANTLEPLFGYDGMGMLLYNQQVPINNTTSTKSYVGLYNTPRASGSNTGWTYVVGSRNYPYMISSNQSGRVWVSGHEVYSYRSEANDISTFATNGIWGLYIEAGHQSTLNANASTATVYGAQLVPSNFRSNVTSMYGVNVNGYAGTVAGANTNTTNFYSLYTNLNVGASSGVGTDTVTNYYDAYLNGATVAARGTLTNKYGVYQVKSDHTNYFAGNVGINIIAPTSNLHVVGNANVSTNLRVGGNVSFDNIDSVRLWEPAANTLTVHTASTERVRVDSTGNVGIGTTNPIYKLDVAGSLNVSSGGAIAGGFTVASFNAGANIAAYGTWTPNPANGNYQYATSNGAVTIAVPASNCAIDVLWYNETAPGSVTFSGYQAASGGGGDSYLTTANYEYILSIRRINGVSTYVWKALQ